MTKVIRPEAIHTMRNKGKGIKTDPIRNIDEFYTLDGKFLFEFDPTTEKWYGLANLLDWLLSSTKEEDIVGR